jgi:hypothetical protein
MSIYKHSFEQNGYAIGGEGKHAARGTEQLEGDAGGTSNDLRIMRETIHAKGLKKNQLRDYRLLKICSLAVEYKNNIIPVVGG